jgi:hypothetical protein
MEVAGGIISIPFVLSLSKHSLLHGKEPFDELRASGKKDKANR